MGPLGLSYPQKGCPHANLLPATSGLVTGSLLSREQLGSKEELNWDLSSRPEPRSPELSLVLSEKGCPAPACAHTSQSAPGLPSGPWGHTGVLSGDEVIVWWAGQCWKLALRGPRSCCCESPEFQQQTQRHWSCTSGRIFIIFL